MIKKSENGIWCDTCKARWGQSKGVWHTKAMTQAIITVYSETKRAKGAVRSYCGTCLREVEQWSKTEQWSIYDQQATAIQAENLQLETGALDVIQS